MAEEVERDLPHREPGENLDRRLSWSGQILPRGQPCRDIALMERLTKALRAL